MRKSDYERDTEEAIRRAFLIIKSYPTRSWDSFLFAARAALKHSSKWDRDYYKKLVEILESNT
jgi:hypothetical protein